MISIRRAIGHAILALGAAADWFTAPIKTERSRASYDRAEQRRLFDDRVAADFVAANPAATISQIDRHLDLARSTAAVWARPPGPARRIGNLVRSAVLRARGVA